MMMRSFWSLDRSSRWATSAAVVGAVTFILGLPLAPDRTWAAMLLVSYGLLSIGLAGALGLALSYRNPGPGKAALRRVPEMMTAALPVGAVGLAIVLVFHPGLYPWTAGLGHAAEESFKRTWLNRPFFLLRAALYVGLWMLFARLLVDVSRRRDRGDSPRLARRHARLAAVFFYVVGITTWLASYDWIMSLEPDWYSTIFGFYNFSGLATSGLAVMILLLHARQRATFSRVWTAEHRYDLGQLLFACCCLWVYMWFSQYLLIWYVNIPEEATYFVQRLDGGWKTLFYLNLVLSWALPFLALIPREAKQSAEVLPKVAAIVLLGRWLDLYLMIAPPLVGSAVTPGLIDVGLVLGGAGVFMLAANVATRREPATE